MGFVQTPHDYRDWKKNIYLTMCYWEYQIFFHTSLISLNERNTALTVGTMCLIRRKAIEDAGGWATWCLTEDSELAIRIHDKGYSSVYVNKTYGRGLIPETFAGYKKQRARWTAGPVQELQYHWKHFFGLSKIASQLSLQQRIHHFNHGFDNVLVGLTAPLTIMSIAVIVSMIVHREIITVPFELWLAATVMLGSSQLLTWLKYKIAINTSLKDFLAQMLASKALTHIITYSAFHTLLTGKGTWNRTSKFKEKNSLVSSILSAKDELIIGLSLFLFIFIAFHLLPYEGLSLMFIIGVFYVSMGYFAAPVISLLNFFVMKNVESQKEDPFNIPHFLLNTVNKI